MAAQTALTLPCSETQRPPCSETGADVATIRQAKLMLAAMTDHHIPLYDDAELNRVLDDMAVACLALFRRDRPPILIGMRRRGEPLAQRLQQRMQTSWPDTILPVHGLQIKRYADDLHLQHPETALAENPALAACDLANTPLLLVDDVLYQGHSLLRAVHYLVRCGATEVRTAVLVHRTVARLPVHADVVGIRLQVPPNDVVECRVPPYEPEFRVDIWHRSV